MLSEAIGTVLPLAVAMALSSVPLMATIGVLLSPNYRRIAPPFLVGSVIGLAFSALILTAGALAIPDRGSLFNPSAGAIGLIVVGVATLVFGIVLWRRSGGNASSVEPKWLSAINSVGPWTAFGIAFGLGLRPKALLLSLAVGLALRGQQLSVSEVAVTLGIYVAIACSTIAAPIVFRLAAPHRSAEPLRVARQQLVLHGRVITLVILLLVGVVMVGEGLSRLPL